MTEAKKQRWRRVEWHVGYVKLNGVFSIAELRNLADQLEADEALKAQLSMTQEERNKAIVEAWLAGEPASGIALRLGLSSKWVRNVIAKADL